MSSATAVLVPLFAAVVIFAVLQVSRLARTWREREIDTGPAEDPELRALEDEKQRLLATLRDLDHEHSLGKLSEVDHAGLKRHFEGEAVRVMDRIDAIRAQQDAEGVTRPSGQEGAS